MFRVERFLNTAVVAAATGLIWFQVTHLPLRVVEAAAPDQKSSESQATSGATVYAANCAPCHGANREGTPPFPPIGDLRHQLSDQQIVALIRNGKGIMPPFPNMPKDQVDALISFLDTAPAAPPQAPRHSSLAAHKGITMSPQAAAGEALFQQNCAFCHGRDAMGGESGPDLTRSKLVSTDTDGSKIAEVIREGRTTSDKKMPAFSFSPSEVAGLIAFIRERVVEAEATKGGRRGVDVSDLQTGNVELGKQYFNGAGGCAKCHSPTGDLAGIATRYEGLQLEERMLYPRNSKSTVTVTLPGGKKISGTLAYRDEFTIALTDANGNYRSWPTDGVSYKIDSPVNAHVDLFSRYTDDDIHNLMAYIQTLR